MGWREERVMLTLSQISSSKMVRSKKGAYKPDSRSSRVEVVLKSGESYDSTTSKALGISSVAVHNPIVYS